MKRILSIFTLAATVLFAVSATAANDPITSRKALMKANGLAIGALVKMAKGEMDFNPLTAQLALGTMNAVTLGFGQYFPENSQTGNETTASPKIWQNKADFEAKLAKYQADTEDALAFPPTSRAELGPLLGIMGGNCKSCHEAYRIKTN